MNGLVLCAVIFTFLPNVFFLVGWVQGGMFLSVLAAVCIVIRFRPVRSALESDAPRTPAFTSLFPERRLSSGLFLCAVVALLFAWTLASGAGGFVGQNVDFIASNSLFADLIRKPWPLMYLPGEIAAD